MAEQIISPGVFSNESDQSLYTQGPQTIGAAIIGPTAKGTPMVPTSVTSYSDYLSKFGDVFLPSGSSTYQEYFTSLAVREYFGGGGQTMLVTKIISGSGYTTFASADVLKATSIKATGSLNIIGAINAGITGSLLVTGSGASWTLQITSESNPQNTSTTFYVQSDSSGATTTETIARVIKT